jgi:hexosaminidase
MSLSLLGTGRSRVARSIGAMALVVGSATGAVALGAGSAAAAAPPSAAPQVVPKPVSTTVGVGQFTLTTRSRIVVSSDDATAVGADLAAYLRPATGYQLPIVSGGAHAGDITLQLGKPAALQPDTTGEGYVLDATSSKVTVTATTSHGLYDAVQTIRQLLPVWIDSPTLEPGPWTIPSVHIVDYPRYAYRGVMLDIARHFQTPAAVMSLIDQASAYKVNTLHLHVSDDQGFRIVINGFPNLTAIGSQGSVGTDGRTEDPGGFWTQADYRAVVAHAAAHFMTVTPEVDSPGHNNAIIMSEYNDTTNPLLNGHPQDINCSANNPPQWNFSGDVGYSALCPESQNSFTIYNAIISQLAAMSTSPYYHLGGDEVPSSILTQDQYASFINQEVPLVNAQGKAAMGWAELAGPGTNPGPGSVAEYWNPASGSSTDTITAHEAVAKNMKIVMAPANHAYLDQKYAFGPNVNVPPTLGLHWACNRGCDVDQFYNWDPGSYVDGVTDQNVIGVEGAMWGETVVNLSNVDYMVFPRLIALAEVGWTPQAERTSGYSDFLTRLAPQGARLTLAATNFYPTPEVAWQLDVAAAAQIPVITGQFSGPVASLSAPGIAASNITASINWGDGTNSAGSVDGTAATSTTVNGLYTISGNHTYGHPGSFQVTITASAPGTPSVVTTTTLNWHR